jgi:hypothetical protein
VFGTSDTYLSPTSSNHLDTLKSLQLPSGSTGPQF